MKPYKPLEIPPRKGAAPVPNLKRNRETLQEHRLRLKMQGRRPLSPEEEATVFPGDCGL